MPTTGAKQVNIFHSFRVTTGIPLINFVEHYLLHVDGICQAEQLLALAAAHCCTQNRRGSIGLAPSSRQTLTQRLSTAAGQLCRDRPNTPCQAANPITKGQYRVARQTWSPRPVPTGSQSIISGGDADWMDTSLAVMHLSVFRLTGFVPTLRPQPRIGSISTWFLS